MINYLVPSDTSAVVIRTGHAAGMKILIHPRSEKYYWTGTHEMPCQNALASTLKPGMSFWDVGTHIGFFSLIASQKVGNAGHVHCFEPLPDNRARLNATLRLNKISNAVVHAGALAGRSGEAVLYARGSSSMWTLEPQTGASVTVPVPQWTLDQMAHEIDLPGVIKIDTEGVELEVLEGGTELLNAYHPILLVEFSNQEVLDKAKELLPEYEFHRLSHRHWLLR
ncbi:MAG: FkbM family methyltransferase [Dehalococcoidia bacterium]